MVTLEKSLFGTCSICFCLTHIERMIQTCNLRTRVMSVIPGVRPLKQNNTGISD